MIERQKNRRKKVKTQKERSQKYRKEKDINRGRQVDRKKDRERD